MSAPALRTLRVLQAAGPGGGRFTEVLWPRCDKLIALVHLNHWEIFSLLCELRRVARIVLHHANTFPDLGWWRFRADLPGQLARQAYWGMLTLMTSDIMAAFAERAGLVLERPVTDVVRCDVISLLAVSDGD
ncbi:MAG TPA: hypothetical protein VH352_24715 [Pseudonocardiaceae bacterium]|jgi:hypothetical protein|nr:hypothetical protein [Pseudonocardiaceae bacterium]